MRCWQTKPITLNALKGGMVRAVPHGVRGVP